MEDLTDLQRDHRAQVRAGMQDSSRKAVAPIRLNVATVGFPPASSNNLRVLLADDHAGWRLLARSFLERERQWNVFEARDGFEAVRKAAELFPDIILLDLGMPGLNGIEAAVKIRQRSPDSKIIFLSLEADKDIVAAALLAGAVAYVLKTEIVSRLVSVIQCAMSATR